MAELGLRHFFDVATTRQHNTDIALCDMLIYEKHYASWNKKGQSMPVFSVSENMKDDN